MPVRLNKKVQRASLFRIGSDNSSAVTIHVVFDPLFTPTPSSSPTSSPTAVSESPVASNSDSDDDTAANAGASFAPNATGVLPPTSGSVPAERLPGEPDPALTPGALNPAVTQTTIGSTICVSGWTTTVRPSSSFTTALKIKQIVQYGYSDTQTSAYEEDHLISLELGGAPADARNLWPEPYTALLALTAIDRSPNEGRLRDQAQEPGLRRHDNARRRPKPDRHSLGARLLRHRPSCFLDSRRTDGGATRPDRKLPQRRP